ncbi:helix-turn-helix transcriptional regulator [Patulibacter minatonensis]|uniref:helix-turn-helix transcriptional regulator n=1 Tax=Patulibacter minatonensis TaxID=298163 RepID=UPI0012F9F559|nr:helix-turn-helix transcriptional regulator [Patulibacter minatonensis]
MLCLEARRLAEAAGISGGRADALPAARRALEEGLRERARTWSRRDLTTAGELLREIDELEAEHEESEVRARIAEIRRLRGALDRLDGCPPQQVIDRAPGEANRGCDFARTLLSSVDGSLWLPRRLAIAEHAVEHTDPAAFHAFVATARIPLGPRLVETDLVRRRVSGLVADAPESAKTFKALVQVARTTSYVVAPVVSGGRAVGLLHADRLRRDGLVTADDRARLAGFASGLAVVHERGLLLERLGRQSRRAAAAFAAIDADSERLVRMDGALSEGLLLTADRAASEGGDEHPSLVGVADGLTARERQIVALMATGASNAEISARLVIAEATVKAHATRLFRKLGVAVRAGAVARYRALSPRP